MALDNRNKDYRLEDVSRWKSLAKEEEVDGILFLEYPTLETEAEFRMRYLNADGHEADMCGNGLRALGVFIGELLDRKGITFKVQTEDGIYHVFNGKLPKVEMRKACDIGIIDIDDLFPGEKSLYLRCGVPHAVFFVLDVQGVNLPQTAPAISGDPRFRKGVNVNFVQILSSNEIAIRTYERGVERETLSCGTGAVASALACTILFSPQESINISSLGGELKVIFSPDLQNVSLQAPVREIEI